MNTVVAGAEGIARAAEIIRAGGLVAFPTETVYGLGGNALDPEASRKIYAAKGRPSDNPLIAHVASTEQVRTLVRTLSADAKKLMEAFWPGPLTIVMPKADIVPLATTGGLETVAVRMPENEMALRLISESGVPIAAPSANTSGKPSPTEAAHVYHDLNGKIDMILDGGPVGIGVESTIIDVTGDAPMLLRPGAVTLEELSEVLGKPVGIDPAIIAGGVAEGVAPKAPGMKYRHYAPNARMFLVAEKPADGDGGNTKPETDRRIAAFICEEARKAQAEGQRVGIICCEETRGLYDVVGKNAAGNGDGSADIRVLGSRTDPLSMTHNLFRILRAFDEDGVQVIFAESYLDTGIGFALMNRMRKAAGGSVLYVS